MSGSGRADGDRPRGPGGHLPAPSDRCGPTAAPDGDQDTYLDFHDLRCALGELPYEHYRHSDNLVVRLNLPNMQYSAGHKVEVYAQAVRGLTELESDPEKQLKYLDFIDIYAALDDNERARLPTRLS